MGALGFVVYPNCYTFSKLFCKSKAKPVVVKTVVLRMRILTVILERKYRSISSLRLIAGCQSKCFCGKMSMLIDVFFLNSG